LKELSSFRQENYICIDFSSIVYLFLSALTCDVNGICPCNTTGVDGAFIHEKFLCDGDPDCTDGSDELNCGMLQCLHYL
jgi:hypothetical protein